MTSCLFYFWKYRLDYITRDLFDLCSLLVWNSNRFPLNRDCLHLDTSQNRRKIPPNMYAINPKDGLPNQHFFGMNVLFCDMESRF